MRNSAPPPQIGNLGFCHCSTQEQELESRSTPPPHLWTWGIWDFVIFELKNKSWKVSQQPSPPPPM